MNQAEAVAALRERAAELQGFTTATYQHRAVGTPTTSYQTEPGGPVRVIDLASLAATVALIASVLADHLDEPMVEIGDPLFNEDGSPWKAPPTP